MPFGKYAGRRVEDVPRGYLLWLKGRGLRTPLKEAVEAALSGQPTDSHQDTIARCMVNPGYLLELLAKMKSKTASN